MAENRNRRSTPLAQDRDWDDNPRNSNLESNRNRNRYEDFDNELQSDTPYRQRNFLEERYDSNQDYEQQSPNLRSTQYRGGYDQGAAYGNRDTQRRGNEGRERHQGYQGQYGFGYQPERYTPGRWQQGNLMENPYDYNQNNPNYDRDQRGQYANTPGMHNPYGGNYNAETYNRSNRNLEDAGWGSRTHDGQQSMYSPHKGKGPKGYNRSDDRIKEDISDRMMNDGLLDASEIEVDVNDREVVLNGTVESREAKRRAEDIADAIPGVNNVENRLRLKQNDSKQHNESGHSGNTGSATGQDTKNKRTASALS